MGFFDSDEQVVVESSVYNLAGDEKGRPNYLQTLITRNILSGTKDSISQTLQTGYLHGPGIALRNFYQWAEDPANFDKIHLPIGSLESGNTITAEGVEPHIPAGGDPIDCTRAYLDTFKKSEFARQRVFSHHWAKYEAGRSWTSSLDREAEQITLTFPASGGDPEVTDTFNITANMKKDFIYAQYVLLNNNQNRIYIYEIGSGNSDLDNMAKSSTESYGDFFPVIPVRIDNRFLSNAYRAPVYDQAVAAYDRLTGASYDAFKDEIAQNPQLGDIDHVYVVTGVSLNVKENAGRKYIFEFFDKLRVSESGSGPHNITIQTRPIVNLNFDMRIYWEDIRRSVHSGKGKAGAKKGDLWWDLTQPDRHIENTTVDALGRTIVNEYDVPVLRFYYQHEDQEYKYLDIAGMYHVNFVYEREGVYISSKEAIISNKESEFIVPIHYDTLIEFSLVDATQVSTACVFGVFNAYVVKDVPWWASGWFTILIVVTIAIASVVFSGGAGLGLLGSHMALGAGFGLSGFAAAVAGSVTNALAAVVVISIVEKIATGIFGETIGGIIAAVAGMVIINASAMGGFNNLSLNWNSLLTPDNLLQATNVLGKGYASYINTETADIYKEIQDFGKQAEEQVKAIQDAFFEEFGYGNKVDPLMFTDSGKILNESPDTFLTRTLMTGSEIVDLSHELITNFAEHTNKLDGPFN